MSSISLSSHRVGEPALSVETTNLFHSWSRLFTAVERLMKSHIGNRRGERGAVDSGGRGAPKRSWHSRSGSCACLCSAQVVWTCVPPMPPRRRPPTHIINIHSDSRPPDATSEILRSNFSCLMGWTGWSCLVPGCSGPHFALPPPQPSRAEGQEMPKCQCQRTWPFRSPNTDAANMTAATHPFSGAVAVSAADARQLISTCHRPSRRRETPA